MVMPGQTSEATPSAAATAPPVAARPREMGGEGIDLVFSDIVMPGKMDGLALAKTIRGKYPRIPILLATGYSDALRKVSLGFQILKKPYEIHELSQALSKVSPAVLR